MCIRDRSTGNTDYQPDTAYLSCIKKLIKEDEKLLVLKEYQEGMASLVSLISTYHMKELDCLLYTSRCV